MNIFVTGQSQLLRKLLQASRSLRHYFTCHSVDSSVALCFCSILVFVSFLCNLFADCCALVIMRHVMLAYLMTINIVNTLHFQMVYHCTVLVYK